MVSQGNWEEKKTPQEFVSNLVAVMREVRRVLRVDGTLWLNIGDSYAANRAYQVPSTKGGKKHSPAQGNSGEMKVPDGMKSKDLIGIPWMVAFALRDDGWYLRQDIIWHKPNAMPASVKDRCTTAHEYIFLLSKSSRYYFDHLSIQTPASDSFANDPRHLKGSNDRNDKDGYSEAGAQNPKGPHRVFGKSSKMVNKRSVWRVPTKPFKGAHFATFPPDLIRPCILAGCPEGGTVLDPFGGSGTTGQVCLEEGRDVILIDINPSCAELLNFRLQKKQFDRKTLSVYLSTPAQQGHKPNKTNMNAKILLGIIALVASSIAKSCKAAIESGEFDGDEPEVRGTRTVQEKGKPAGKKRETDDVEKSLLDGEDEEEETAPPKKGKGKPAPEPEEPEEEADDVDYDEIREKCVKEGQRIVKNVEDGRDQIGEVLTKLKVKTMRDAPDDKAERLLAALKKIK